MGRKIPGKKHRGVKDPIAQQARRLESLKGKINTPPNDPDDQPVPQSLIRLFGLHNPKKKDNTKKKNHIKMRNLSQRDDNKNSNSSTNPISQLRKLPGESGRSFSLRINSAVKALHGPEEDLHYPQDLEDEDYKGARMAAQRERRARKRRRVQGEQHETRLSRTQKLALKRKAKKMKTLERGVDRGDVMYERVTFGDVTHSPPNIRHKNNGDRPGRRNLLLTSMLVGSNKRDPHPPAEQQRRERARQDAIAAYRAIKASKYKHK